MKKLIIFMVLITLSLTIQPYQVMAGGSGSYPNGAEAFLAGAIPPPGFYFINYAYYYGANDMYDDRGHKIDAFDDITVKADVLRFLWISKKKFLGADYGQHLFIPYLDVDLDFKVPVGPKNRKHYSDSGLPYLIYSPMVLAYHLLEGKFHVAISLVDIYVPSGQDDENLASVGHNFWTFEPVVGLTYMLNNWAFSAKLMYDWSTTQDDCPTIYGFEVDRDPGQEFHADYSISYGFSKALRVGVSGYYYKQTTDDDYQLRSDIPAPVQDLLKEDEGNQSEVLAYGPGIWYNHKNMFFSLRTQWETEAESKTEGQNFWFKFTYVF